MTRAFSCGFYVTPRIHRTSFLNLCVQRSATAENRSSPLIINVLKHQPRIHPTRVFMIREKMVSTENSPLVFFHSENDGIIAVFLSIFFLGYSFLKIACSVKLYLEENQRKMRTCRAILQIWKPFFCLYYFFLLIFMKKFPVQLYWQT